MWQKAVEYLQDNYMGVLAQIGQHIKVSLMAILIAALFGIVFGYLASGRKKGEGLIAGPFEVLRVVPSLAILILLIPFIGTGVLPAVIALTLLAIPPILLNTMVGFREVPYFMVETAKAMGMTKGEALWKVRIPLALPMIFAGLRTALVEVIASATLAAKIGAGGLGEIIFTGLGLNRPDLLVIGGLGVAILSLGSGFLFDLITSPLVGYRKL